MDFDDQIFIWLNNAVARNDFRTYNSLVDRLDLNSITLDFLDSIFKSENYNLIKYWLESNKLILSTRDLVLIPLKFQDLFRLGISKKNLSFEDATDSVHYLLNLWNKLNNPNDKRLIKERIDLILNDPRLSSDEYSYLESYMDITFKDGFTYAGG
jgi:hypothetical protein